MTTKELITFCKDTAGADLVGIAPSSRFSPDDAVFRIMPDVKSVIGIGFRVLRGSLRGIEEGTTYYQYSTMSVENLEETVMPCASLRISMYLEDNGYTALPQRREQYITAGEDDTNPEVLYDAIWRGRDKEQQLDFENTACLCGLGERGFHGTVLCDEFGPLFRYVFILTDAELEGTQMYTPHLCDGCRECVKGCPGHAIDKNSGKRDDWQCAVYYAGANGTKNPFMPPEAFPDLEERIDIIAGEAKVTPKRAREILNEIHFYPPVGHFYQSSICGKACDTACYIHLEEKGVLTKKFKEPFRKRPEWKFDIDDFRVGNDENKQEDKQ